MELDEAIKHCNDKVIELEQEAQQWLECNPIGEPRRSADKAYEDCKECAAEHKQLAEWLTELKEWRKLKPICSNDGILVFRIKDEVETYTKDDMTNEYLKGYNACKDIIQPKGKWNNHTVACLLADLFGDPCACNYCGIDEWLPKK